MDENKVFCLDRTTKKEFTLNFDDFYKQRSFLRKCKYSKKIFVLGYTCASQSENELLTREGL